MKCAIFWNCRRLGNPSSINALQSLVQKFSPEILFLSETKCNKKEIRRVQDRLRYDKGAWIEAAGRAGGIALFWTDEVEIQVKAKDDHFIDCIVSEDGLVVSV